MTEQMLAIFHGTGANGESTLLRVFEAILGDYPASAPAATFTRKGPGDDLLPGARNAASRSLVAGTVVGEATGVGLWLQLETVSTLGGTSFPISRRSVPAG